MHNITPDKVIYCFREGDIDSLDVAAYYKFHRRLPLENLVALPCSADQTITEAEFITQIQVPLLEALNKLDQLYIGSELEQYSGQSGYGERNIWVIILGYHIPNFYIDSYGQKIAIASRVQRIRFPYSGKVVNHTYNKQIFNYFTDEDIENFYITAILDGPTPTDVINMINSSILISNSDVITGRFYLDPYGLKSTEEQISYRDELIDFEYAYLPYLGLDSKITVEGTTDSTFRSFQNDSFYWGWFTPYCPKSIFKNQSEKRVFLYNADNSAASNIRLPITDSVALWCNVAQSVSPPYAATAGAFESPGIDAYLRPEPFFRALHLGATLGEAFMSACPYLDWKIVLIGDPLLTLTFPFLPPSDPYGPASLPSAGNVPGVVDGDLVQSDQVGQTVKWYLENSISYRRRALEISKKAAARATASEENKYLLSPLFRWRNDLSRKTNKLYSRVVSKWYSFVTESSRKNIDDWFDSNTEYTTTDFAYLINHYTKNTLNTDYIYPTGGFWSFTFYYIHPITTREKVHFEIEILDYKTGSTVLSLNSLVSNDGWEYESRPNVFVRMTDGFFSSLSGRRVRYRAPIENYLSTLEIYRVKWRALHANGTALTEYTLMTDPIIVAGDTWSDEVISYPYDTVTYYANAFGYILEAGEYATRNLTSIPDIVKNTSTRSMPVYQMTAFQENPGYNPLKRRDELISAARDLSHVLRNMAYASNYYVPAFQGLYQYVNKVYGQTIDEYLTTTGYKVIRTFARVSEDLGEPISKTNIFQDVKIE